MTPAQRKGLVVGQSYLYHSNGEDYAALDGQMVRFRSDDGTNSPSFYVPTDVDSDGWTFLQLKYIGAAKVAEEKVTFSVTVEHGRTVITIGKELTAAEAASVLAAAGIK